MKENTMVSTSTSGIIKENFENNFGLFLSLFSDNKQVLSLHKGFSSTNSFKMITAPTE